MHSRRALLYMPGDDRHKIEKALTLGVDCICMDLEDGVAASRKAEARRVISAALAELDFGQAEKLVRINPVGSGLEAEDLEAVLPRHPDGIVLPKVEGREHLERVVGRLEAAELANGWAVNSIRLLADVETARGIPALGDMAAFPRLDAFIFGAEDYAASLGVMRTVEGWEVFTARSLVVMHAKAHGLQAIDMVCMDFSDLARVRREAEFGAQLGYTGKQVIHPAQVGAVQEAFTPGDEAIKTARQLVEAFESQQQAGRGAFAVDGKLVDMPSIRSARSVLEQARAAGKI